MSHPEPQDRSARTPREPGNGRDVPAGDYPYGPDAAASPPRSPWPGQAADAQPSGGGWASSEDPWGPGARDAAPVRYGADAGWQQQDASRYGGGATDGGLPTSTVVLLVVSGLGVLTGFATLAGVPALIIAIVAATSASTDRERAERLTRTGWIVFVAIIAASVLLLVLGLVLLLAVGGGLASGVFAGF